MRTVLLSLAVLSATPAFAAAEASDGAAAARSHRVGWSRQHPVALGVRGGVWMGEWAAPGIGGHIKVRPFKRFGIELFADNYLMVEHKTAWHNHVIGFSLYTPIVARERWNLSPTLGMCADFAFATPVGRQASGLADIRFGVHGGALFEVFVGHGFSVQAQATLYAYFGNYGQQEGWSAFGSDQLSVRPVGQLTAAASYYF